MIKQYTESRGYQSTVPPPATWRTDCPSKYEHLVLMCLLRHEEMPEICCFSILRLTPAPPPNIIVIKVDRYVFETSAIIQRRASHGH